MTRQRVLDKTVPWDELDQPIRRLVEVLNGFTGIATIGSCGGHPDAKPGQWRVGTWYVKVGVAHTEAGWRALEFLSWFANNHAQLLGSPWHVTFYPTSPPPYLNHPGKNLSFALEGSQGDDPDEFASHLIETITHCYVPARGEVYSQQQSQEGDEPTAHS